MSESVTELVNIWSHVKERLSETVDDKRLLEQFISESFISKLDSDEMVVAVSSKFSALILSTKYLDTIQKVVKNVIGYSPAIKFVEKSEIKKAPEPTVERPQFFKNSIINSALTFDSFITGPNNLEAKQAAMFIASNPGENFNPLFIYSNPGLGKTHLLHAIANYTKQNNPGKRALYCETTDFIQEFVTFINGEKYQDQLKDYLCSFDILLIDDIQSLATKEQTCYFFFDIFNHFFTHGKQIVITSDKHPNDLKGYYGDRLISRFLSGLTISIKQPDVQTCVAILKSKISNGSIGIEAFDPEVIEFVAEKFSKNVREIDQALHKLVFYTTITKPTKHIDMDVAMEALQSLIDVKESKQKLSEQRIINTVAEYYQLTPSQITGPSREGKIAMARHISMYLIRTMLDVPYSRIGYIFGGKDHSTVMSGVDKVEKTLKINSALETAINEIKALLKQ